MSGVDLVAQILAAASFIVGTLTLVFYLIDRRKVLRTLGITVDPVSVKSISDGDLVLRNHGRVLSQPTLINVHIQARDEISTSKFDDRQSLTIDFGVDLVSVLSQAGSIAYEIVGHRVLIRPQLIQARNELKLALLVDGEFRMPEISHPVLRRTTTWIRMLADVERERIRRRRAWQASIGALIGLLAASVAVANAPKFVPPPGYGLSDEYKITYPGTYGYEEPTRSSNVVMPFLYVGDSVDVECEVVADIVSVTLPYVGARSTDIWVRTDRGVYIPVIYLEGFGENGRLEPHLCAMPTS